MEQNIIQPGVEGIEFGNSPQGPLDFADQAPYQKGLREASDFDTFEVSTVVPYTDAADANYYTIFYVPHVRCFLLEARMRHAANGGSGAAVRIEKLPSGTARGAGQSMTNSAFDITAGANITQRKTATITLAGFQLNPGDAMALRASGTLTNAQHVGVTVLMGINRKDTPISQNASTIIIGI